MENVLSIKIDPDEVTLEDIDQNAIKHFEELEKLSELASKEYGLEKMLYTMQDEWI